MKNLFTKEKILDFNSIDSECTRQHQRVHIRLSVFGAVKEDYRTTEQTNNTLNNNDNNSSKNADETNFLKQQSSDLRKVDFRLILYLDDYRLLLCQFSNFTNNNNDDVNCDNYSQNQQQLKKFFIPIDRKKGHIIAMCTNSSTNTLLALTNECYLYLIPLDHFSTLYDEHNDQNRVIVEEDARLLQCLSLHNPTAMVWWERPYSLQRSSIAIIGNKNGQLVFVDLDQEMEFKLFTFVSGIERLQLYDEAYSKTLLVTCSNKFQHYLILDPTPAALDHLQKGQYHQNNNRKGTLSLSTTTTSGASSLSISTSDAANYLWNCVSNYGMLDTIDNDDDDDSYYYHGHDSTFGGDSSSLASVLENNSSIRPQLITIFEDLNNNNSTITNTNISSPMVTTATNNNHSDFFDLEQYCLRMTVHPQPHSRSVFVIKQSQPKYDFSTNSPSSLSSSPTSSTSSLEDNNDQHHSASSSSTTTYDLTRTFCSVTLSRNFSLDVYEFGAPEFSTKSIILSGSRLFLVNIEGLPAKKNCKSRREYQKLKRSISKSSAR